jgi:paraquat-inducible protein A
LIAALILYIPANLLPVTITTFLGSTQSDTIMSGVIFFMQTGSWGIALIIFVASIVVPIAKLIVLSGLLISIQRRSRWRPEERTRLYRITELVGRWSMLDVFVVAVLVALVRLGYLTTIEAGSGVAYFAAVVVITMIAAMSFDPRLIWDVLEKNDE